MNYWRYSSLASQAYASGDIYIPSFLPILPTVCLRDEILDGLLIYRLKLEVNEILLHPIQALIASLSKALGSDVTSPAQSTLHIARDVTEDDRQCPLQTKLSKVVYCAMSYCRSAAQLI